MDQVSQIKVREQLLSDGKLLSPPKRTGQSQLESGQDRLHKVILRLELEIKPVLSIKDNVPLL